MRSCPFSIDWIVPKNHADGRDGENLREPDTEFPKAWKVPSFTRATYGIPAHWNVQFSIVAGALLLEQTILASRRARSAPVHLERLVPAVSPAARCGQAFS